MQILSLLVVVYYFLPAFFIHFRCCLSFENFRPPASSVKMPEQQPWRAVPKAAEELRLYTATTT